RTTQILRNEVAVRKLELWILVQRLHVRVCRSVVEVVVALLHVFAVIAFVSRESEQSLFENRILSVPEREREAKPAFAVGNAEQAILAPPVRAASGHVMGEALPDVAGRGVVLADGAPLSLGEVRTPPLPIQVAPGVFVEANRFSSRHRLESILRAAYFG